MYYVHRSLESIWLLIQLKRYALAEEQLGKVLQDDSQHADALAMLALAVSSLGRGEEAKKLAWDAISLNPVHAWYHYILATVRINHDDVHEAITALIEAVRLNPTDAEYFRMLGRCYSQTQQYDSACWCVLQSLTLDPEHVPSLLQYGIIEFQRDKLVEAEALFQYVLARDPENAMCHEYLGWIRMKELNTDSAHAYFQQSLRLQPESSSAESGLQEAEWLILHKEDRLHQLVTRWHDHLGHASEGIVIPPQDPFVASIIAHDQQQYTEPPCLVQMSPDDLPQHNLLEDRAWGIHSEDKPEPSSMNVNTQLLVLKIILALLLVGMTFALIVSTK